jgi:hypothetical protein
MAEFCFPTDLKYDIDKILEEYRYLMSQVLYEDPNTWIGRDFDINLVHRPEKEGRDRMFTESGSPPTYGYKYKESEFTEFLEELRGGYLHHIYTQLSERSNKGLRKFRLHNRGPGKYISWHKDPHSGQRYHISMWTNESCLLLAKKDTNINEGQESVHIPVDGRVWELKAFEIGRAHV